MCPLQEADRGWRLVSETTIKARSMKGFNTAASKIIDNKFILGEAGREMLEDWDQRTVHSVLELHEPADISCCKLSNI